MDEMSQNLRSTLTKIGMDQFDPSNPGINVYKQMAMERIGLDIHDKEHAKDQIVIEGDLLSSYIERLRALCREEAEAMNGVCKIILSPMRFLHSPHLGEDCGLIGREIHYEMERLA